MVPGMSLQDPSIAVHLDLLAAHIRLSVSYCIYCLSYGIELATSGL
jgi:hypothetical protein